MSNTDWKDETVQELKKGYMAMIMDRDERIAILTAGSEAMQEDADRKSLIIFAKEQEISELTRMLFALGKQDGQTIRNLTEEIRTIKNAIEDIKIYCNNPSAWEHYDDGVSEKIRAILKAAGMA